MVEDGGEVVADLVECPSLLPRRPLPCPLHLLVAFLEVPGGDLTHTAHIPEGGREGGGGGGGRGEWGREGQGGGRRGTKGAGRTARRDNDGGKRE